MSYFSKLLFMVASFFSTFATAVDLRFPHGCEAQGFGFYQDNLVINETGSQALYLFQNQTDKALEIERVEDKNAFMSPPLLAHMDALQWASFASDIANLNLQCFFKNEEDNPIKISCQQVLAVCKYPRVKFALSNMGNYWVSVNRSQQEVVNDTAAKGIYLRW